MKSHWSDKEAKKIKKDLLALRVYTSRLLGQEEDLVLHGGGNTSVKIKETNIFGEEEEILYVKGSGWDLATIEKPGFAPVKLEALQQLAQLDRLSDMEMVKYQRMALTNPSAPNPSVEAILHGIIPYTFVDHTHADAVVTMTNSPGGKNRIEEVFGSRILIVPYVMPGFILAKKIYDMTRNLDWDSIDGMILLNHGVFTFHDDPKVAYENMIRIVNKAEQYLHQQKATTAPPAKAKPTKALDLATLRREWSLLLGKPAILRLDDSEAAVGFSVLKNIKSICNRGPLTPDHIIRTKRNPVVLSGNFQKDLERFAKAYQQYFYKYTDGSQTQLDAAPRWAVWPGHGTLAFGTGVSAINIIEDISRHTQKAIHQAETLGGWKALPQRDLFEMEYWSLEQAKLKKATGTKAMQGKIALVTGAASGIGKACVERLLAEGAVVAALDIDKNINRIFQQASVLPITCDVTNNQQLDQALEQTVRHFGGLDLLITNAGTFPPSSTIADMKEELWQKSIDVNLSSHLQLLKRAQPFLELGFDPAIVIIASKNVPAPGPGAAAYSVAKAGLTQLGRIAAMEMGPQGIRVNMLHPNAIYDTGIWTAETLKARAANYKLSVAAYQTNNILKVSLKAADVAELAVATLGTAFSKVTGAQIPIDGGNERVI